MDTKDVKALKKETEEKILDLLEEFVHQASFDVVDINLDNIKMTSPNGDDYIKIAAVKIEVEI